MRTLQSSIDENIAQCFIKLQKSLNDEQENEAWYESENQSGL